jgi:hypothetical protein
VLYDLSKPIELSLTGADRTANFLALREQLERLVIIMVKLLKSFFTK